MLRYAREAGRPCAARAHLPSTRLMLKALADALTAKKEELYALSYNTGATKADSWIDIDGGIGTFAVYQGKGRRELPNDRILIDGNIEALSRNGTFQGSARLHVAARRRRAHQRVQLPRLGHAGKARADVPRRHARDRETRQRDQLSHRSRRAHHARRQRAAERRAATHRRFGWRSTSSISASATSSRSPAPPRLRTNSKRIRSSPTKACASLPNRTRSTHRARSRRNADSRNSISSSKRSPRK
jgi:hypothetical protein